MTDSSQRLAKFLAACGIDSRRKCESIIAAGRVTVNGETITTPAVTITPDTDSVTLDGISVTRTPPVYLLLYKPRGVTCSSKDVHAKTVVSDILPKKFGRLFTVGRLDRDSEGLIICTNDGDFAQNVAHPRHETTKIYHVEIDSRPNRRMLKAMVDGIEDEGEILRAVSVTDLSHQAEGNSKNKIYRLEFVLIEGKKREIRRLCRAMHWNVKRLVRIAIGPVTAPQLAPGEWRHLTPDERQRLSPETK